MIPFTTRTVQTAHHAVAISLCSPLPSLVAPNILSDTLYHTHHASPLIADLQGHPAKSDKEHRATLQLEILSGSAVWHPPLLLGRAPMAQLSLSPAAPGDWLLIRERAEVKNLESRWRGGAAACCSLESWQPCSVLCQRFLCLIFFSEEHLV